MSHDKDLDSDKIRKEMAKKMRMKEATDAWERHVNKMERLHVLARRRQIKKEGFKSELDYFTNKKNV